MASGSNIGSASSLSSNQSTFGQSSSTASSNWSNLSQSPSYGSSYSSPYDSKKKLSEVPKNARYAPSPKHEKGGWGSLNPVKSKEEGERLLKTGYKEPGGKQIYNITEEGKIIVYQPDNTGGYHCYEIKKLPPKVLKIMRKDGKIRNNEFNEIRKNKWKGKK